MLRTVPGTIVGGFHLWINILRSKSFNSPSPVPIYVRTYSLTIGKFEAVCLQILSLGGPDGCNVGTVGRHLHKTAFYLLFHIFLQPFLPVLTQITERLLHLKTKSQGQQSSENR